jgi:class 3 adenylate cyclase
MAGRGNDADIAPVAGCAPSHSAVGRFLLRAGNPLDWSTVDKVILSGVAVWPFTIWYWIWLDRLLAIPSWAPFFNRPFLKTALAIQGVFVVAWFGVIVTAYLLRRRSPENRLVALAAIELYCVGFAFASYYVGHYTAPFGAIVGFAGAVVIVLLFEPWVAATGILSFFVVLAGTTVAEQLRLIPYAPLFQDAPVIDGQLHTDYLLLNGVPMFAMFAVGLILGYYIIDRWRDRDLKLAHTSKLLARANDVISRYVASQLAAQFLAGNYDAAYHHERRKLTLFFSDIKDFSATADEIEPEELAEMLNEYLCAMTVIGERYGATIDKFVGDAVMIFFGAPSATSDRDHALRTVRMALEMQARMASLREEWRHRGLERPFDIRIGINTGHASVGSFGSPGRMDYTAIGRQVNLAARLQTYCEPGKILLSHSTWVLVHDEFSCAPRGEIDVKGFHVPVRIYEVVADERASIPQTGRASIPLHTGPMRPTGA